MYVGDVVVRGIGSNTLPFTIKALHILVFVLQTSNMGKILPEKKILSSKSKPCEK